MNPSVDIPILVNNILNKVREFKKESTQQTKLLKDLARNPKLADREDVQKKVERSTEILKSLFQMIDELDVMEGKMGYDR